MYDTVRYYYPMHAVCAEMHLVGRVVPKMRIRRAREKPRNPHIYWLLNLPHKVR